MKSEKKLKSRGLGDSIKKVTDATGISTVVEKLFGDNCGCKERQERLNKLFPYTNYMKQEEFEWLDAFFERNPAQINTAEKIWLTNTFNRIYNRKLQVGNCVKCYVEIILNLKNLHSEYKRDITRI